MKLTANWIWQKQEDYNLYNQTVIARKLFQIKDITRATLAITADSQYRVLINDEWVNDGPCRSWPEHYQYDAIDVTSYLHSGNNEIRIIAKYYGVGTFHQVPQQAGLLAQLEIDCANGEKQTVITDESWEVAEAKAWTPNTPKVSCQMEPFEDYDARLEDELCFSNAAELYPTNAGPWKGLNPRDCRLLTRTPFALKSFMEANIVDSDWTYYCFPAARLMFPGIIEANNRVLCPAAMITVINAPANRTLCINARFMDVTINGKKSLNGEFTLEKGANLLYAMVNPFSGHAQKEVGMRFQDFGKLSLSNPIDPKTANPWAYAPVKKAAFLGNDMIFVNHPQQDYNEHLEIGRSVLRDWEKRVKNLDSFKAVLGHIATIPDADFMLMDDVHEQFTQRKILTPATVDRPEALQYDNGEVTTVKPDCRGDVELVYDFAEQNCGHYQIDLIADEGVVVDIFAVEHITSGGVVQHSSANRNGMRYVCKKGVNRFTSLKRRSGRFLFVTLRNMTSPVRIRSIQLIESTYPVSYQGLFSCSDTRLDQVWDIAARTLKLCMEDTYTDCPLYEQTHWVGDARNEAIFAFTVFGAEDLARRCATLTGQSLERYPMAGCQLPSAWDCILPAWSLLWGISIWDYYEYTGDAKFVKRAWPWVKKNLKGAEKFLNKDGLFTAPFWNMFDWTDIDHNHETVIHVSMFIIGAIDAALKCAEALKDETTPEWLCAMRERVISGINALWDVEKGAYPDSVYEDGTISPNTCQHTSFLGLLYDIVEKENVAQALDNVVNPPEGMTLVGSPFAIMYMYEALEKCGRDDVILKSIYDAYLPMLREGATTVWETFFTGDAGALYRQFPTRSHCHAWSSAPVHFLNRIVLGLRPDAIGGKAFTVRPQLYDLTWAKGATATINGPVKTHWHIEGEQLIIDATAAKGTELRYVGNDSHKGLTVIFNGKEVS